VVLEMLNKAISYINARMLHLRQTRVISRSLCFCGVHRMRIGLGWSGIKRYDTCFDCRHSVWIEDIEGNKKVNAEIQKHINSKSV